VRRARVAQQSVFDSVANAVSGSPWTYLLLAAVCAGDAGDNSAPAVSRSGLRRLADRVMNSEKSRRRLDWARTQLLHRGVWIIVVARFIPGGQTATTYVAGTVGMPWSSRFLPADSADAALWALYSSALGYFGGAAFKDNFWLPMLIAAAASTLLAAGGELLRRKGLWLGTTGHAAAGSGGLRAALHFSTRGSSHD
jgi:membrane-associated protein